MLPVRARRLFATTAENQKFVTIELYQGDSTDVAKNRKLGQVVLDDLPGGNVRVTTRDHIVLPPIDDDDDDNKES